MDVLFSLMLDLIQFDVETVNANSFFTLKNITVNYVIKIMFVTSRCILPLFT